MRTALLSLVLSAGVLAGCRGFAQPSLTVHPLNGDRAVLQRDAPLLIRGEAPPGSAVRFASPTLGTAEATATPSGAFALELPPQPAGGPHGYVLTAGDEELAVGNVVVGDVFVASGQSNMEWPLELTDDAERALAVDDEMLREIKLPLRGLPRPDTALPSDVAWLTATDGQQARASGVAFYLAELLRARDPAVPIGVINNSWGGSRIEAWLPEGAGVTAEHKEVPAESVAAWARLGDEHPGVFSAAGLPLRPHGNGGRPTEVGKIWEWTGYPDLDGVIWYDTDVALDAADLTAASTLSLGAIDDSDSTFVNGSLVGAMTDKYAELRSYEVPTGVLREGNNQLSIRVEDLQGGGGLVSPADTIYLRTPARSIPLGGAEQWRTRPARLRVDSMGQRNGQPTALYNGMVAPTAGVPVKAVLWYQGESNAGSEEEVTAYGEYLRSLVGVFRKTHRQDSLPVYVIELPEWTAPGDEPYRASDYWPGIRQAQASVLRLPRTSTTVTLGLGDVEDIHPRNKLPVARRLLAEVARLSYGDTSQATFARPVNVSHDGRGLVVTFEGVGESGLRAADGGVIRGFAVQGADGAWHAASAQAQGGSSLRVDAPAGVTPVAVAYAWSNTPDEANLVNGYDLPVSSFRRSLWE